MDPGVTRLADIPVRVEAAPTAAGLGGGIGAILSEIAGVLDALAAGGLSSSIDLRSLPMSPGDRAALQRFLGEGEVQATLKAQGCSTFRETARAGVWWIEHRNPEGDMIAELLEITRIPAILAASLDEIAASAAALRSAGLQ